MALTDMIAVALALLLAYIYVGYPALLWLCALLFGRKRQFDSRHEPSVTLVISAYNEVEVIAGKIENSLALDYPKDKLCIMVVSDCSSDGTDEVVRRYAGQGVQLVRAEHRRGKTSALNQALERVESDIVVFSDANAIYDREAIRFLVGHFVDSKVGYVVGHARYQEESRSPAGGNEGAYWNLEVMIKQWEGRLSSVVGGDGAIYAIRRPLYEPMQETDINDFVNPLQIVAKGYRGIFERRAWCVEHPAGEFGKEFSRKVRIANRSFNAVLRVPQALNPLRVGLFAWQLFSHKLLRWFSPFFLAAFIADSAVDRFVEPVHLIDELSVTLWGSLLGAAFLGWLLRNRKGHPLLSLPYYFVLMNMASAKGILLRLRGTTISTWNTVRADLPDEERGGRLPHPLGLLCALLLLGGPGWCALQSGIGPKLAAWMLIASLGQAYLVYPLLLVLLGALFEKKIDRDDGYLPTVTLLIVAYNEERDIGEKLLNSLELDYPQGKLQLLVASDGSSDGTDRIVSGYGGAAVELIAFPENRGKIAALNDAMKGIDSEIVVLSDANVMYDRCALRKLVRNFNDPRVGAVSGKVVLVNDSLSYREAEHGYYSVEHFIQEREGRLGTVIGADGAMYAIRRSLFRPPSPDTILDDLVIAMGIAKSGYLVLHEKEALGFETNRLELAGEFRRKARIIAGGYQCLLRGAALPGLSRPLLLFCFLSHKVLRWTSGLMLLGLLIVLLQIQYAAGVHLLFTATLAALVAALFLALLVQLFPRLSSFKVSGYSHYFFMLMAASLVGCYLGLTGRQKVAWRGGST